MMATCNLPCQHTTRQVHGKSSREGCRLLWYFSPTPSGVTCSHRLPLQPPHMAAAASCPSTCLHTTSDLPLPPGFPSDLYLWEAGGKLHRGSCLTATIILMMAMGLPLLRMQSPDLMLYIT